MHHRTPLAWRVAAVTATLAVASPSAAQQSASNAPPAPSTGPADSAAASHHSRPGRFGRLFEKAASAASTVGARAGVSKETAARLAITAATGGAAAVLMQARVQGASSAAALVTPRAAPDLSRRIANPASSALTQEAMRAMTDLATISARAQQHDPAAMRALQSLNAAMATPDAEFVVLQRRATAGDPAAAQAMLIREDAIARAALGGTAP